MTDTGPMIDRYQLLEELGRGGMAQVYRARDTRMRREVAVKLLPSQYLHDANFKARFEREAQTIAALEHPAIVPIHDYGEHDGQPYLVMRFMAGGSLADLVRMGRVPLSDVAPVLGRVAGALDYAHSRGVVHRDLKPANVMFDADGHAYLSDFGIARLADATTTLTKSGVFIGTPAKVMMKHVLDPVPQLRDLDRAVLPGANQVVDRALAKNREERFDFATQLAAAVAELAGELRPVTVDAAVPPDSLPGSAPPAGGPSATPTRTNTPMPPDTPHSDRHPLLPGRAGLLAPEGGGLRPGNALSRLRRPAHTAPAGCAGAGAQAGSAGRRRHAQMERRRYSTVTLFAKLRGWSTSAPRSTAMW